MKLEAMEQLYDVLYSIGQQIVNCHNPCDWKDGRCRRMRSSTGDKGCCEGCKYLNEKGCTVQSLACTLWLCESQINKFKECEAELKILHQVADYCGIPYEIRRSKEENFTLQSQPAP